MQEPHRARCAVIDIGTNTVLLLVAEPAGPGRFLPVLERAEITRLGKGVDRTGQFDEVALEDTLRTVVDFAEAARSLGAERIAAVATSAARDASNGPAFLAALKARAGITAEIITGDEEAELSFLAASADFGSPGEPLVVLDIGGGSTEVIYGRVGSASLEFRQSFAVGSVRLTERFVHHDPMTAPERQQLTDFVRDTFSALPPPPTGARLVGVAGTVTTLFTVQHQIEPYDAARVHGGRLARAEVSDVVERLCSSSNAQRLRFQGLAPKRADVIPAGAIILEQAMAQLLATECTVSDRGLRWGLLARRFGS